MLVHRNGLQGAVFALIALAAVGCQTTPKGEWQIETGRALMIDKDGERRPRIEAVAEAQQNARLKLLRHVEAMPTSSGYQLGDYMAQQARIGQRVRDLVIGARRMDTRYTDEDVEVDMGLELGEVRRVAFEASIQGAQQGSK